MLRRRSFPAVLAVLLLVGCRSPEAQAERPRPEPMTREAYLEWRAARLLRAEAGTRAFAEVVETPAGEWPGHLEGRTISFSALFLSVPDDALARLDPTTGRAVRVVLLGDPERSDRDVRLCLDADDHTEGRARFDDLAARSGEWQGTPVKVTAFMTGVPEDPALTPWIGKLLAVERTPPGEPR